MRLPRVIRSILEVRLSGAGFPPMLGGFANMARIVMPAPGSSVKIA